jgi:hypothetical protein
MLNSTTIISGTNNRLSANTYLPSLTQQEPHPLLNQKT